MCTVWSAKPLILVVDLGILVLPGVTTSAVPQRKISAAGVGNLVPPDVITSADRHWKISAADVVNPDLPGVTTSAARRWKISAAGVVNPDLPDVTTSAARHWKISVLDVEFHMWNLLLGYALMWDPILTQKKNAAKQLRAWAGRLTKTSWSLHEAIGPPVVG